LRAALAGFWWEARQLLYLHYLLRLEYHNASTPDNPGFDRIKELLAGPPPFESIMEHVRSNPCSAEYLLWTCQTPEACKEHKELFVPAINSWFNAWGK
jgi:hypothetical protein